MTKTILISAATAVLATACTDALDLDKKEFIIAGNMAGSAGDKMSVFIGDEEWEHTEIDEDGEFRLQFEFEEPAYFTVTDGNAGYKVFMSPGDSIYLSGTAEDFEETAKVTGDNVEEIEYIRKKGRLEDETGLHNIMELMSLEAGGYLAAKDSAFEVIRAAYDDLEQKEGIDADFLAAEDAYFTYSSLLLDRMYPTYHAYVNGKDPDGVAYPRASVDDEIAMLPKGNESLLLCEPYIELIDFEIMKLAESMLEADTTVEPNLETYMEMAWQATDSLLPDPEVRNYFYFLRLRDEMEAKGAWKAQDRLASFREMNDNAQYEQRLKKIEAKWEPLKPGSDVPDFTFTDTDGETVRLSDFRGKPVYIDIWATWCGPCIREHPYWDSLKTEYADRPVAFLTVSVDNSREPWVKMVADKNMEGNQLYAENAWQSDLARHFIVQSIPRFILLDADGKVIDPVAERPSGNIRETLEKHLTKAGKAT